jgi:LemA protein
MEFVMVFFILLVILAAYFISIYNRLVSRRNEFKNAFSQIDVQLQRRYELIPNLVESTKAYLKHEQATLTRVIVARNNAQEKSEIAASHPEDARSIGELMKAESNLGAALGQFNVVVESYPELKADQSVQALFDELVSTDNRVGFARQAYSDSVMYYNTECQKFPANVVSMLFSFKPALSFEIKDPKMTKPVRVSFA